MEDNLKCAICLEFSTKPVETSCCHQIYCRDCLKRVSSCPSCRKALAKYPYHSSQLAARLINAMPMTCQHCGRSGKFGETRRHELVCPERAVECQCAGCEFTGKTPAYLKHLIEAHSDELVHNLQHCLQQSQLQLEEEDNYLTGRAAASASAPAPSSSSAPAPSSSAIGSGIMFLHNGVAAAVAAAGDFYESTDDYHFVTIDSDNEAAQF